MDIYDVIVVGGGPAGATAAALIAANGGRVIVLEKSHFPREKLCGEFLSPECGAVFERLGVEDRIRDAEARPIRSMDLIAPDGQRVGIPASWFGGGDRPALGLSRARLDAILLSRAKELGADVLEGVRVSPTLDRRDSYFEIEGLSQDGVRRRFAARLIVDASGRGRLFSPEVAQSQATKPATDRLFGCKVHLRGIEGLSEKGELYFFDQGYGGLSEVEPDGLGPRANLCFLTNESMLRAAKGDRERLLELTLMTNPAAKNRLRGAVVADAWLGAGPIVFGEQKRVTGVIAIGDAGAFIDPFTGSGILLALSTGELASSVVNDALGSGNVRPEVVAERYRHLFGEAVGWRFRAAATLRRLAFAPLARKLLVPLLTRHEGLTRMLARSTRQGQLRSRYATRV